MKALVWQAVILSGVLALVGCTKQDNAANEETKEVPMTAKPADSQGVSEQTDEPAVAQADAQTDTQATEGEEAEEEIAEVIDFDEKEAATATADAEVVDEGETDAGTK